jgi:hypothetical protein
MSTSPVNISTVFIVVPLVGSAKMSTFGSASLTNFATSTVRSVVSENGVDGSS